MIAPILAESRRLAIGVAGPVAVAGTQFAAAMLIWGHVPAAAFGAFSFAMLLVQLSYGLSNALVGTPLAVAPAEARDRHRAACLAAHGAYLVAVALAMPLLLAGTDSDNLPLFAFWVVMANLRWTARADAIAQENVAASARSDLLYAAAWCAAGAALLWEGASVARVLWTLIAANILALAIGGRTFLADQIAALTPVNIRHYARAIWPRQAGWSIVGVVSTEASSNAHAYIVTWAAGAALYAPLAFGGLFVRPLTIFLTALTQIERPRFVRRLEAGETGQARALIRNTIASAILAWAVNLGLALILVHFFAGAIIARGYDAIMMRDIVLLWFAIMLLRTLRNPLSTLLQARCAFRPLAWCSIAASVVSLAAVVLSLPFGPTWSLAGILCGEAVFLGLILLLYKRGSRCGY